MTCKYASRNQTSAQRAMHSADRIANRLHDMWKGITKGEWEFPPKPSRMRWKTYWRLKQQHYELRRRWVAGPMGHEAEVPSRMAQALFRLTEDHLNVPQRNSR